LHPRFEPISHDSSCDFCSGRRQPATIGIDAAYCISLVEQPARTARAAAHFHAIGLCRQVIFYRPSRAKNTDHGVWASHRAVAQAALAGGYRRVLILEDDVVFRRPIADLAPRITRALGAVPPDWWGIYLGHFPFQAYFVAPGLLRTRSVLAHAYIANAPLLDWLASTKPATAEVPMWRRIGVSIDSAMSNLPAMYAVVPMMVMQKFFGDYRIDSKISGDGRRRKWTDIDRWRNLGIFRGTLVAEALAIICSPFHALTLERNIRRVQMGLSRDAHSIRAAGLFDDGFYLRSYPDVATDEVDPLLHYLMYGASEGRWPNPAFDPKFYASQAATLRRGENPLLHYIATGRQLGYATRADPAAGSTRAINDIG
jgi:hypothetical protein